MLSKLPAAARTSPAKERVLRRSVGWRRLVQCVTERRGGATDRFSDRSDQYERAYGRGEHFKIHQHGKAAHQEGAYLTFCPVCAPFPFRFCPRLVACLISRHLHNAYEQKSTTLTNKNGGRTAGRRTICKILIQMPGY
ncbi:hypothetical protein Zmor_001381 [Zophobas morio]|uniref:Uncharacterized protein n=1 Tax=Zophobas morio TaxID=2755281 RepID=A0AA38MSK4_9CUCU|nr:hypothetical protein Zmor_001381 [Zophobas morio]